MCYVIPYIYEYITPVKGRWFGSTVQQVLEEEFHFSKNQIDKLIHGGLVQLSNLRDPTRRHPIDKNLEMNDIIKFQTIFTEKPIPKIENLEILSYDSMEELLVLEKPGGMPVQSTGGRFRKNTLSFMLENDIFKQFGRENIHIPSYCSSVHRLDRVTSGIMIYATSEKCKAKLHKQFISKKVKKVYLARVHGNFPNMVIVDNVLHQPRRGLWTCLPFKNEEECIKAGIDLKTIKIAKTKFVKISYCHISDTSLILCFPITGRTHQIREHCKIIGHPIINDFTIDPANHDELEFAKKEWDWRISFMEKYNFLKDENVLDKMKMELLHHQLSHHNVYKNQQTTKIGNIALHAYFYQGPNWTFTSTKLPKWVNDGRTLDFENIECNDNLQIFQKIIKNHIS